MSNPYTNKEKRGIKIPECIKHQPFIRMIKTPGFYGWKCPKCNSFYDEMIRTHHLERIRIQSL